MRQFLVYPSSHYIRTSLNKYFLPKNWPLGIYAKQIMVVPLNPASEQECAQGPELLEQRSFSATLSLGVGDRGAFFLCKLIIFHISIVMLLSFSG